MHKESVFFHSVKFQSYFDKLTYSTVVKECITKSFYIKDVQTFQSRDSNLLMSCLSTIMFIIYQNNITIMCANREKKLKPQNKINYK